MIQLTIMAGLWLKKNRLFPIEITWIIYRLRFLQNSTWKYIDYVLMLNMAPRHKLGNTFPRGARKHPVVVFMNICLIFMNINRPERGTSSSQHRRKHEVKVKVDQPVSANALVIVKELQNYCSLNIKLVIVIKSWLGSLSKVLFAV